MGVFIILGSWGARPFVVAILVVRSLSRIKVDSFSYCVSRVDFNILISSCFTFGDQMSLGGRNVRSQPFLRPNCVNCMCSCDFVDG